ncbi:NAD-dependent epimerase/dehydratase family protein [Micromonospora sp. DT201]|uniref:NAD-dependent epimerase/dehydratase family protein n=1 Tax=Micromonospora sp. DT201 TaxID=3393442 RepID=UPI003CF1E53B
MRIIVVGGAGTIGRRLVPALRSHGHDVVGQKMRTNVVSPTMLRRRGYRHSGDQDHRRQCPTTPARSSRICDPPSQAGLTSAEFLHLIE